MLEIKGLKKTYPTFQLNCSLRVNTGCITGLIGSNGAGKSTTFKAILGLIQKEDGSVRLFGKESTDLLLEEKERIGVVLSDSGFSNYLTLSDIIAILASTYRDFDKQFFLDACTRYQLPLNKKLKDFSTGMKAKVKILAALSHHADFLILDEPTAGLDVLAREDLLHMLRDYMAENEHRSILISSHISTDLEDLCDDYYMIEQGSVILHEDAETLFNSYGILKMTEEQYQDVDKQYLLRIQTETYGYSSLTNQRQFYLENYPAITVEKGTIDHIITMMVKGEQVL